LKVWRSEEGEESDSAEANDEELCFNWQKWAMVTVCAENKEITERLVGMKLTCDRHPSARTALNILDMALTLLPYPSSHLTPENVKGMEREYLIRYNFAKGLNGLNYSRISEVSLVIWSQCRGTLQHNKRHAQEYPRRVSNWIHSPHQGSSLLTIFLSDADAALYWLGRMLQGGEDPLYVARRLVRAASEDIGLADNTALPLVGVCAHFEPLLTTNRTLLLFFTRPSLRIKLVNDLECQNAKWI
jgi:hypothetical protein